MFIHNLSSEDIPTKDGMNCALWYQIMEPYDLGISPFIALQTFYLSSCQIIVLEPAFNIYASEYILGLSSVEEEKGCTIGSYHLVDVPSTPLNHR